MFHFLAAIIYTYLAVRIYNSDRSSAMNRTALALLLCFAVWSFGMTLMSIPGLPPWFIHALWHIYPAGWLTFPVIGLLLFLIMTDQKKIYTSPAVKAALFILPLFFLFLHSNNLLMYDPVPGDYGWYPLWKHNIWAALFYIYFISFTFAGIMLMFLYSRATKSRILKRMSRVIIAGSAATLALGALNEVLLKMLSNKQMFFSQFTDIFVLFWAFSIMYAVSTYGFFRINPAMASDNIIANMNDFLILLNEEIQVEYANTHVLDYLGYTDRELAGMDFSSIAASGNDFNGMLKSVLKNGSCRYPEFYFRKKDGTRTAVAFSASLMKEMGDMVGIVCVASDISEVKMAQETLKESYDRLKELDDLKSNFTSVISHELRTPLTAIKGFLYILQGGAAGPINQQQREYIDIIKNNSERLLSLINDLLDISKMESGKFTIEKSTVPVKPLLDKCIKDVSSISVMKNIIITLDVPGPSLSINVDEYRFSQAVTNLLSNSIKFSERNSYIRVSFTMVDAAHFELPAQARNAGLKKGSYGFLCVKDQGIGVDAEQLGRIFDRFYQVESADTRTNSGTGLGLNIVKNIIEQHGGMVWAESGGLGKGTEFKILIPG
jgi:PAS domain S-box-containing protein